MHQPLAFVGVDDGVELGLVIAAVLTVIILAAAWLLIDFWAKIFSKVPVVGHYIAAVLDWAARWARGAMLATLHGTLWAIGKLSRAIWAIIHNQMQATQEIAQAIIGAVEHTRFVVIAREIQGANALSRRLASQAFISAVQFATMVQREARQWSDNAYVKAHNEVSAARQQLLDTIRATATQLYRLIQAAQARADQQFRQAEADAQRLFQRAEADAQAGDSQAVRQAVVTAGGNADKAAAGAWAGQWQSITAGVAAALAVAGTDFPEIARQLRVIVQTVPETLTQAEAAAAAAVPPMLTALEQCVLPGCRDLGNLRSLLHTLQDAVYAALLLAWLIQMITDPITWARETYDAFGPLTDAELAVIRAIGMIP